MIVAVPCLAQAPAPYQDLYTQLSRNVSDFQTGVDAVSNGTTFPVAYAGQLTDANCNNGPALLQSSSMPLINSEILLLKAIGVKAISVEVSFPMLDADFFDSIGQPSYQSQFTTFYANVAAAIRAQGLKVIVESQSMIPTGLQSKWGSGLQNYYASIPSFSAYETARAQTAALVAQTMKPDYFVLQEEPDTEANQSGQASAGTVSGSTDMLSRTLAAVRQTSIPGMKIGAGFGTWLQAYELFANAFTQQRCGPMQPCISAPLDFLDLHAFPITEQTVDCSPPPSPKACTAPNFSSNTMAVVATAKTAGVPLSISQTWLRKVRDAEWLQINGDIQEAREAYDFWESLDFDFLHAIASLANYGRMLFVVPFNTQSYSAYLTWNSATALQGEGGNQTPAQVFAAVQSLGISNAAAATYTTVATRFHDLIVSDTVPPSAPANVMVSHPTPATAIVTWTASTDDVGVAGYRILRNGTQIATVFQPPFQDSGLSATATYSYDVIAFDLGGNASTSTAHAKHRAAKH
jgi:hypothetical protein